MSGQRTIIYKKPIAKKAARVYNLLEALPIGSHKSRDEIHELCNALDYYDVSKALK